MGNSILYPSIQLSEYVKYYWIVKAHDITNRTIQTIPSGCIHLVFHRGNDLLFAAGNKQPKSFIRGQLSFADQLHVTGEVDMIAVVFHPLGINPFIKFPAEELYNQYVSIESLNDNELNRLRDSILNETDTYKCIQYIEQFLLSRLTTQINTDQRIANSIRRIKNNPETDILSLADQTCLSYRHFKRLFTQHVGINPKEYTRIIRLQKALFTLQKQVVDFTELAYICGYFDHSHLVKDFKSLTNYSPTEYLSLHKPYSTFFSNDCKVNLIKANNTL